MATTNLIAKGTCSRADFEEMGGWLKSTFHEDQSVYFTIAADSPSRIRLYLTVTTGKVFR